MKNAAQTPFVPSCIDPKYAIGSRITPRVAIDITAAVAVLPAPLKLPL